MRIEWSLFSGRPNPLIDTTPEEDRVFMVILHAVPVYTGVFEACEGLDDCSFSGGHGPTFQFRVCGVGILLAILGRSYSLLDELQFLTQFLTSLFEKRYPDLFPKMED